MSTIRFKIKEFADIATTLALDARLNDRFLSSAEIGELVQLDRNAYPLSEKDFLNEVKCFVHRLYIANDLAFETSYGTGDIVIKRLTAKELDGEFLKPSELLKQLKQLRYNVFNNAGYTYLGQKDEDKLNGLIAYIRDNLEANVEGWN